MMNDCLVIFTYAPAGLGHLRVANSLSEGLKSNITPILLGSKDKGIETIHNIISLNPLARTIMEWVQRDGPQEIFTSLYRNYLRSSSGVLYNEVLESINQRLDVPKKIVFVCTHFGIAHKLAIIKEKLAKELGIKIYLVVQVTDDSPQYIWYVPGADLIFVPSEFTKNELLSYANRTKLNHSNIKVVPYPINPFLAEKLSQNRFRERANQLNRVSESTVEICIPISGAAVSTDFYKHLIQRLCTKSRTYSFHIVSRMAPFTKTFLHQIKEFQQVKTYTSSNDREVVDLYDEVYKKEIISLEITKPSEQAFKALLSTDQVGGSLLLFSKPVGRQEYDNLEFLRKHKMLFSKEELEMLWNKSRKSESISDMSIIELFEDKLHIRGIELPIGSEEAANFIWWCLNHGIFEKMLDQGTGEMNVEPETKPNGVKIFWQEVENLVIN